MAIATANPEGMSLSDHLGELRSRVLKASIALALGTAVGFLVYQPVLDVLVRPYCDLKSSRSPGESCRLLVTDPLEGFAIRLKLSLYLGLLLALPVILWQLWRFITPGLHDKERRYAIGFVSGSTLLFVLGAVLAMWTFPKTLEFFAVFGGDSLELFYSPGKYLSLLTMMMLIFGLGFEFPILLVFLQLVGIVHWRQLVSWRRYALVGIVVVDAVITPSGDPVTLFAMAIPMCLFYEASILIGRFVVKRS